MKCKLCGGSGFIVKNKDGEDVAYPCKCRIEMDAENKIRSMLINAHIHPKYWDYTFENYLTLPFSEEAKAKNKHTAIMFKEFLDNPEEKFINGESVVWIWGPDPNACHTSLAVMFAKELLLKNYKVRFIKMQDLLDAFIDWDNKKDFFELMDTYSVYLIDDAFDTDRCSAKGEYTQAHIFNWLDNALNDNKRFICTCNCNIKNIHKRFEQAKILLSRSNVSFAFYGSLM